MLIRIRTMAAVIVSAAMATSYAQQPASAPAGPQFEFELYETPNAGCKAPSMRYTVNACTKAVTATGGIAESKDLVNNSKAGASAIVCSHGATGTKFTSADLGCDEPGLKLCDISKPPELPSTGKTHEQRNLCRATPAATEPQDEAKPKNPDLCSSGKAYPCLRPAPEVRGCAQGTTYVTVVKGEQGGSGLCRPKDEEPRLCGEWFCAPGSEPPP